MARPTKQFFNRYFNSFILFLSGCALTFLMIVGFLGWGLASALGFSLAIPVFCGGLVITGLAFGLKYIGSLITSRIIDKTIQHHLAQLEAANNVSATNAVFEDLVSWLAIANHGIADKNCLNYEYKGQSLLRFAITQSESHLLNYQQKHNNKDLLLSQEWVKFIQRFSTNTNSKPLNTYQKLILLLKKITGITWNFTKNGGLDDKTILDQLTESIQKNEQKETGNNSTKTPKINHPSSLEEIKKDPLLNDKGLYSIAPIKKKLEQANGEPQQEKYTPIQTLHHQFSLPKAVVLPEETKASKGAIAPHLQKWTKNLVLIHQQQQHQQQQQQQQVQQDASLDLSLDADQEAQLLVDNSTIHATNYHYGVTPHATDSHWFKPLVEAVFAEADRLGLLDFKISNLSFEQKTKVFLISEQARNALLKSANLRYNTGDDFDLSSLHGFWIVPRPDKKGFILKFDPLFEEKTKCKKHQALYVKPVALGMMQTKNTYTGINTKYTGLLKAKQETFTISTTTVPVYEDKEDAVNWLPDLAKELFPNEENPKPNGLYNKTLNAWFDRLQLNAKQRAFMETNFNFFPTSKLIAIYRQSSLEDTRRFIQFLSGFEQGGRSLSTDFILPYWNKYPDCNWTHHLKALEQINAFNDNEYAWFKALTDDAADLDEVVNGLVYFFNYFKEKKLPLPPVISALEVYQTIGNKGSFKFMQLRGILECLSLAQDPTLQALWIEQLPKSLTAAKTQLHSGYTVVHRAMCFEKHDIYDQLQFRKRFPQLVDPFHITTQELATLDYENLKEPPPPLGGWEKATYSNTTDEQYNYLSIGPKNPMLYRAFFLRFCAANLEKEHFHVAIAKWEELMDETLTTLPEVPAGIVPFGHFYYGPNPTLDQKLKDNWPKLKECILALPVKISDTVKNNKSDWLVTNNLKRLYDSTQLDILLKKLNVDQDERKSIQDDIDYLNDKSASFPALHAEFQTAIDKATQRFRSLSNIPGKEQHQAMLDCLALMREAHCRLSQKKNGASDAGEWLRLEQAVVILLDYRHNGLWQIKTDEGKTLILQFISMLQTLQGKEVTVITHNQSLAAASASRLKPLARLFGIKIAHRSPTSIETEDVDIIYSDISTAVIQHKRRQLEKKKPASNKIRTAKIDEADNVLIDIHTDTTMQISNAESKVADKAFTTFLNLLNQTIRIELCKRVDLISKQEQRQFIIQALKDDPYYIAHCQNKTLYLDRWINAAVTAMSLEEKIHYVIENQQVRIVHKDTTGRVDRISQWGKGVHQCVAAWEAYKKGINIHIPAIAQVLAEGNVLDFLQTEFDELSGFTGTIGGVGLQKELETVLFAKNNEGRTYLVPPAKRSLNADATWPLVLKEGTAEDDFKVEEANKRFYKFKTQIFAEKKKYLHALLTAIKNTQAQNLSGIVFLNTIEECDNLAQFFLENGIEASKIQILDDTEEEANNQQKASLRPGEATVIDQAKNPGMITLSTATGGRGTDFDGIEVGINAKPSMHRVEEQAEGRLARHSGFAMFYELYWQQDMELESVAPVPKVPDISDELRFINWQKTKQDQQLKRTEARRGMDQFKEQQQKVFFDLRSKVSQEKQGDLEKAWYDYFTDLCWQEQEEIEDKQPPPFKFN